MATEIEDLSLFGLLGRAWQLDAGIVTLGFDHGSGAVAWLLEDGSVALARLKDAEPAARRLRISAEDGRPTILPRRRPLPPLARLRGTAGALTAYGRHGFVQGDGAGRLATVTAGGERTPWELALDGPITAIDQASERLACVIGGAQVVLIARGTPVPLPIEAPVTALRFAPGGDRLAIAGGTALALWDVTRGPARIAALPLADAVTSLAWSPDQRHLAGALAVGEVALWRLDDGSEVRLGRYPAPVRSLAWSSDSAALVTSGAFRLIAWPAGQLQADGGPPATLATGKPSLVAVETVATHPQQPLVAAGYENGLVLITALGAADELLIKGEGQGAVRALQWSPDGRYLALGAERGLAAIVELPAQLFKPVQQPAPGDFPQPGPQAGTQPRPQPRPQP